MSAPNMEDLLAIHLAELGLPFLRQFAYAPGRRFKADFAVWRWAVPPHLPESFALIEVQGGIYKKGKPCPLCGRTSKGAHGSVTGVLADNTRLYQAFLNGWALLRFTPQQVESGAAKAMIEAALRGTT